MGSNNHDIFISFSFKDQAVTEYVGNLLLSKYHISYWMCTRDLIGGEHYKGEIAEAIKHASLVLMIQSEHSLSSREVPKEISIALDYNKPVIPFVLDNAELQGDLEYDLIGIHRVDARKPTLEERVEELARQIYFMLQKKADTNDAWGVRFTRTKLMSTPTVIPKKVFCGRDDTLKEIHQSFLGGERMLFLYGIGGIGKTQIAKQYVKQYRDEYDTVVFATYSGSLRDMVVSDAPFCLEPAMSRFTMSDGTLEPDDAFFERKLDKIRKITDEKTLIVIDNFDVEQDEYLGKLLEGNYRLLITTRCDYSKFYPTVKIDSISSMESLKEIFMHNYDGYDVSEDDPGLDELIELVNRHTYTVELLAQHMENSGQTAEEMVAVLKKEGISSLTEEVKGADMKTATAYENLLKMFRLFTLTEEEKSILMYLSLMPIDGINVRSFREWAQLDSTKLIKGLENKSWLIKNAEGIALHPVIRDVICHEIPVTYENCGEFLRRFTDAIEDKKMWLARQTDKKRYALIGKNIAEKFPKINKDNEDFYYFYQCLLSFSVDREAAIVLADRLYRYQLEACGEISFKTGRAAFKCGWIHTVNIYCGEHIDEAIAWLEQADNIFNQVTMTTTDEISRHTMTKNNLAKMYLAKYEQTGDEALYRKAKETVLETIRYTSEKFSFGDYHYAKIGGARMQYAEILLAGNEYQEGLEALEQAIELLMEVYGTEDNSDMTLAFFYKAQLLFKLKKEAEAIGYAKKSAALYEEYFGNAHPRIHDLYLLIGDCLTNLDEPAKAQEYYHKALKTAELTFSPDSNQVAAIKAKIM